MTDWVNAGKTVFLSVILVLLVVFSLATCSEVIEDQNDHAETILAHQKFMQSMWETWEQEVRNEKLIDAMRTYP